MPERLTVRWRRQWSGNDRIVWVSIDKLDKWWRKERGYYLSRGQGRPNAYGIILQRVLASAVLPMPHLSFDADDPNRIGFTDGRHRFAWVRDHDGVAIPVTFHRTEAQRARDCFGTGRRVCQVRV